MYHLSNAPETFQRQPQQKMWRLQFLESCQSSISVDRVTLLLHVSVQARQYKLQLQSLLWGTCISPWCAL